MAGVPRAWATRSTSSRASVTTTRSTRAPATASDPGYASKGAAPRGAAPFAVQEASVRVLPDLELVLLRADDHLGVPRTGLAAYAVEGAQRLDGAGVQADAGESEGLRVAGHCAREDEG